MADAGNSQAMKVTMVICTIVTFMFMGLRFYCKQYLGTKLALDDLILAFSWVSAGVFFLPLLFSLFPNGRRWFLARLAC